jgi:hypothetical protein
MEWRLVRAYLPQLLEFADNTPLQRRVALILLALEDLPFIDHYAHADCSSNVAGHGSRLAIDDDDHGSEVREGSAERGREESGTLLVLLFSLI